MAKILGIGGVFFKSDNPKELAEWYAQHLGITIQDSFNGAILPHNALPEGAYTVWSPFDNDSEFFSPSTKSYMFNFIVDNIAEALKQVEAGGATVHGEATKSEFGTFGWFTDPDGNKVELWEMNSSDKE